MKRIRTSRHQAGFTMLEVLAATTILSFAVIAVAESVSVAQSQTFEALHSGRATALAEAFLEEVVSKPYVAVNDRTEPASEDRLVYDSIDDYDGLIIDALSEDAPQTIADIRNTPYPSAYQKFKVVISTVDNPGQIQLFEAPVTGMTVTITVTDKTDREWKVSRFVPAGGAS